jgi:putative flippase GtrA
MKQLNLNRYIKFIIVGAFGIIPNYIIYFILRAIIPNDVAWFIGICAGATSNYILNEVWTFNE